MSGLLWLDHGEPGRAQVIWHSWRNASLATFVICVPIDREVSKITPRLLTVSASVIGTPFRAGSPNLDDPLPNHRIFILDSVSGDSNASKANKSRSTMSNIACQIKQQKQCQPASVQLPAEVVCKGDQCCLHPMSRADARLEWI